MSMLIIAAAVFHARGLTGVGDLERSYAGLGTQLGDARRHVVRVALLARGLSSSSVGTLAGQVVMQGFIRRQIPLFLRRASRWRRRCRARARRQPVDARSCSARSCSRSASRSR